MDIGSIFLVLAVLLLVVWYVARPFIESKSTIVSKESQELSHLLAERDRVLNALQELEFDFQLGKIPAEDYPHQRELMLHHGAEVLRQIDALQVQVNQAAGQAPEQSAEDRIEAAVAARRMVAQNAASTAHKNGGNGSAAAHPDDQVEVLLAERRRTRSGKSAGFCHKCGGALQTSDRFCPKCGTAVAAN